MTKTFSMSLKQGFSKPSVCKFRLADGTEFEIFQLGVGLNVISGDKEFEKLIPEERLYFMKLAKLAMNLR